MNDQILMRLKATVNDLDMRGVVDVETQHNVLKEELQYYVLDFICHHREYSSWVMYGGSALRLCYGLDRMSVDLDFEIDKVCTDEFLNDLQDEIFEHFKTAYAVEADFLTIKITHGRGLLLKFHIEGILGISHPSKQVHVKIDLNHFTAPKTVHQRVPVNHGQLSFVITTYNMSSLMASKIAAIFQRGQRGVDKALYEEKGRDIYDLLWYMEHKTIPDLDYLKAKKVDVNDLRTLFDQLTLRMNRVSDVNLKQDLTPLFENQRYIEHWLENWRQSYQRLVEWYGPCTVISLNEIIVEKNILTDIFFFGYFYLTAEGGRIVIRYALSDYWIEFREGDLSTKINNDIIRLVSGEMKDRLSDKLKQYVTLFNEKNEAYLKKMNRVVLGDRIITKTIRMTADKLNQKEQIFCNKSQLLSCRLEDLLK